MFALVKLIEATSEDDTPKHTFVVVGLSLEELPGSGLENQIIVNQKKGGKVMEQSLL